MAISESLSLSSIMETLCSCDQLVIIRIANVLLDYFFASESRIVQENKVLNPDINFSDHLPVALTCSIELTNVSTLNKLMLVNLQLLIIYVGITPTWCCIISVQDSVYNLF